MYVEEGDRAREGGGGCTVVRWGEGRGVERGVEVREDEEGDIETRVKKRVV